MTTIGSLCTGYGGLDDAAQAVTGGEVQWHCEYEDAPSRLLAHRFPGIPNHGDLKLLKWAEHFVGVLTGGYPCQPFSGAGKRLGVDDPRHLFPWIAQGIAIMRPPLVLLENVRNHLNVGFDVVLAALHHLNYDVRWTLLPASRVGAPHLRTRLWIAARAREVGGWPAPGGDPTAHADGDDWISPHGGLFGSIAAGRPGPAGTMVAGARWDSESVADRLPGLLPTPTARLGDASSRGASHPARRKELCAKRGGELDEIAVHILGPLLPTPVASDSNAPPTPERMADRDRERGFKLPLSERITMLPTPRATDGTKGGPNQRGSSGDLMLPSAVQHLLPTPAAGDAKNTRNSTAGRSDPDSQHHSGDTLCDVIHDGRLLPTPAAMNAAMDPGSLESCAWGDYAPAVHRWETLTRLAPPPTEPGRSGPRLSPRFVEWMQGLPVGWVTDVPGLTRNQQLTMLGNGVVPQCAEVAYALLGIPELFGSAVTDHESGGAADVA